MTITKVTAGANLQAAIDQAKPGDTLALEAGAAFVGNFVLPNNNSGMVLIRSDGPTPSVRPNGAWLLPRIITPNEQPAISTKAGSGGYDLLALEIAVDPAVTRNNDLVRLGDGSSAQSSLDSIPSTFLIRYCYLHGHPACDAKRGIALNARNVQIMCSRFEDFHIVGQDSQAICGWNTPGDIVVFDNYIEGGAENLMIGGPQPFIAGMIPTGIHIYRNHFRKPLSWRYGDPSFAGKRWTVKNLLEIKNGSDFLIEENLFENCWADAQVGTAVLLSPRDDDGGAPWTQVKNGIFRKNVVRGATQGMRIAGHSDPQTQQTTNIEVTDNLFEDISKPWGNDGWGLVFINGSDGVVVARNTILSDRAFVMASGAPPTTRFAMTNNAVMHGVYGLKGDGAGIGNDALAKYFPDAVFSGNCIVGGFNNAQYPAGNVFQAQMAGLADGVGADRDALKRVEDIARGTVTVAPPAPTPDPTPSPTPAPPPTPIPAPIQQAFEEAIDSIVAALMKLRTAVVGKEAVEGGKE